MFLQLLVCTPMMANPCRRYFWSCCFADVAAGSSEVEMPFRVYLILTTGIVVGTLCMGIWVPNVTDLMSLVGGIAAVTYAFTLPAMILWKLRDHTQPLCG